MKKEDLVVGCNYKNAEYECQLLGLDKWDDPVLWPTSNDAKIQMCLWNEDDCKDDNNKTVGSFGLHMDTFLESYKPTE